MSNEDESDIIHTGDSNTMSDIQCDSDTKWMVIKSNNDIYQRFMCEFENGRKTNSVDAERLFSLARLSKNYLQCRMKPDVQERNVFLAKNKPLFQ